MLRLHQFGGKTIMKKEKPESRTFEAVLRAAVIAAIQEMGLEQLKKTSFFMSNRDHLWPAEDDE